MSERQSDSMRFKQDLDAHITRSDEQPQPVTFEALIDALRAKEEVISEEEVLRFVEALGQQVRALRDQLKADGTGTALLIAGRLTALLGKPRG